MTLEKCFDELGRLASVDAVPMTPESLACDETSDPATLCADPQVSVFIPIAPACAPNVTAARRGSPSWMATTSGPIPANSANSWPCSARAAP